MIMAVYEAAALAMRYWFLIAAAIVLLGVTGMSIKEYREKRFVLSVAQSSIGYLTVVSGPEDISGENIQLMRENTIGRSRGVDIVLRDPSIIKAHSQVYMTDSGIYVNRLGKGEVTVNGEEIVSSARIYSGDFICFGNIVTRFFIKEEE
jgi:pSer/pThr/pTyr-binding forkhead associated (FHA) protein